MKLLKIRILQSFLRLKRLLRVLSSRRIASYAEANTEILEVRKISQGIGFKEVFELFVFFSWYRAQLVF